MKKIIYLIVLFISSVCFQACDSDPDLPVLTEDDYPRILGRWPDRKEDGELGTFDTEAGIPFSITLQFTPSAFCEGIWYLDGVEYCRGTVFEYYSYTSVSHHIKIVVTTPKNTTSREAILNVKVPGEE